MVTKPKKRSKASKPTSRSRAKPKAKAKAKTTAKSKATAKAKTTAKPKSTAKPKAAKPKVPAPIAPRSNADLVAALASTDYLVYSAATDAIRARLAASPDRVLAHALCELGITLTSRDAQDRIGYTCIPAISEAIPAAYDILVSTFGIPEEVRLVLERIPEERRTAIMRREIDRASTEGYMFARIFDFMDLTPEALAFLVEDGRELGRVIGNHALGEHAKHCARIAEILADARTKREAIIAALPPTPPPPPKPKGPFDFTFHGIVYVADANHLTGVDLAQWRAAASAYFVGDVTTAAQFRKKLKAAGLDPIDGQFRRWNVLRDQVHVYDLWIIAVDNGVVFPANQPERVGVYLIQDDWQATDTLPASQQLEKDLVASAPRDLWTPR